MSITDKNFLVNLVCILLYVCCASLIVINMTISISCKKIYGNINDVDMNIVCPVQCVPRSTFPGVERAKRKADFTPWYSASLAYNEQTNATVLPHALLACTRTNLLLP